MAQNSADALVELIVKEITSRVKMDLDRIGQDLLKETIAKHTASVAIYVSKHIQVNTLQDEIVITIKHNLEGKL